MYEELTERLRKPCYDCKLWDGAMCCLDGDCTAKTRLEAADVIDELSDVARVTATIIENEKDMRVIARELGWLPVAERLPDEDCIEGERNMSIRLKENELYQEIEIFDGDAKIGEMEVDIKGRMLSRLTILEPYRDKGYGQQAVEMAKEKYGCNCLWVVADNDRAIHVYEKLGFAKVKPTMYLMSLEDEKREESK